MALPPQGTNIGFFEVIKTTSYKYAYALLLTLVVGSMLVALILSSLSPTQLNVSTDDGDYVFEVKDSTEQPVEIDISHTFPISVSGSRFQVTEGPQSVHFSVNVTKNGGGKVLDKTSSLDMPAFIRGGSSATSYTVSEMEDLDLSIGTYSLRISSDHPVDVRVNQKNTFDPPLKMAVIVGILGVVIMVAVVISTFKKRDSIRASRTFAAMVSSLPPSNAYSGGRLFYTVPEYPPSHTLSMPPVEDAAVDHICARCGNVIQNPVVQNVITCENCGEREYVG
jgi:hypothetical protein